MGASLQLRFPLPRRLQVCVKLTTEANGDSPYYHPQVCYHHLFASITPITTTNITIITTITILTLTITAVQPHHHHQHHPNTDGRIRTPQRVKPQ